MVNIEPGSASKPIYAAGLILGLILLAVIGLSFALAKPVSTQTDGATDITVATRQEREVLTMTNEASDVSDLDSEELPFGPPHSGLGHIGAQPEEQIAPSKAPNCVAKEDHAPAQYLVLGSFRQFKNAEQMVITYPNLEPGIMSATVRGQQYYRVVSKAPLKEAEELGIRSAFYLRVSKPAQVLVVESWN